MVAGIPEPRGDIPPAICSSAVAARGRPVNRFIAAMGHGVRVRVGREAERSPWTKGRTLRRLHRGFSLLHLRDTRVVSRQIQPPSKDRDPRASETAPR